MKPIMISLNQIKACKPPSPDWLKILEARDKTDDEPFPLSDMVESTGISGTVWAFRCLPEYSDLWRKFACWCSLQVIDKAKPYFESDEDYELVVDYLTTCDESLRIKAFNKAWFADHSAYSADDFEASIAANTISHATYAATAYAYTAADAAYAAADADEKEKQTAKLKQILDAGEWVE